MGIKTLEEALEAVRRRGLSLKDVPLNLRTVDLCIEAVRQHHGAMMAVPMRHREAVQAAQVLTTEAPEDAVEETMAVDGALALAVQELLGMLAMLVSMKMATFCLEAVR
ncbi:MAG: hypothetical protein K6E40_17675 [Desulfovibrio sp.]|nr:hypothetical protein [Desulfovibrio sp.]